METTKILSNWEMFPKALNLKNELCFENSF